MLAAHNGHDRTVQLLLDNNANIDAADQNGETALLHAIHRGHLSNPRECA